MAVGEGVASSCPGPGPLGWGGKSDHWDQHPAFPYGLSLPLSLAGSTDDFWIICP